ncbi:MAG: hypothetical protein HPY53_11065 [Brevinematales bacterium]|nr:hypothetical protein [Brevinematales bacterium]
MKKLVTLLIALIISSVVGCSMGPKENAGNNPLNPTVSIGTMAEPTLDTEFDTNGLLFVFQEPVNIDLGTVVLVSSNIRPIYHNGVELYPTVQFIWMSNNTTLYIKDSSLNIAGIQEVELRNFWNKDKSKKLDYYCENIFRPEFTGYIETIYDVQNKKLKITFPQEIKSKADDIVVFVGGQVIGSSAKSITADTRSILVSIDLDDYPTIVVDKVKFYDGSVLSDKVVHMRNILPPFIVPTLKGFIANICTNRLYSINEVDLGNPDTVQKYRYFDFSSLLKRVRSFKIIVNGYVIGEWDSGLNFNEQKKPFALDRLNSMYTTVFRQGMVATYNVRFCAVGYNGQTYETNFTFAADTRLMNTNNVKVYEPIYVKSAGAYHLTSWTPVVYFNSKYSPQSDYIKYIVSAVQFGDHTNFNLAVKEFDYSSSICSKPMQILAVNTNMGIVTYQIDTEIPMENAGNKLNGILNMGNNTTNYSWKTYIAYPSFTPYAPDIDNMPVVSGSKSFGYGSDIYAFDGVSELYYVSDKFYPVLARNIDVNNKAYIKANGTVAPVSEMGNHQEVSEDYHSFTTDVDGKMAVYHKKDKGTIIKSTTNPLTNKLELGFKKSFNTSINDGSYVNTIKVFSFWSHFPATTPYINIRVSDAAVSTPWSLSGVSSYNYIYLIVSFDKTIITGKLYYGNSKAWNVTDPACTINQGGQVADGYLNKYESINFIKSWEAIASTPPPGTNFQNAWVFTYPIYYGNKPGVPSSEGIQLPWKPKYGTPTYSAGTSLSIAKCGIYDYRIVFKGLNTVDVYGQPGKVTTTIYYDYVVYINDPAVLAMLGVSNPVYTEAGKTYTQNWDYYFEWNYHLYNRVSGIGAYVP